MPSSTSQTIGPLTRHRSDTQGEGLYQHIKKQIQAAELSAGDRLMPTRELQKSFGISYGATLVGLRRLQREGFIVSRPGAGNFVSEATAGVLGRLHTKQVRIIDSTPPSEIFFYRPLVRGLTEQLSSMGCDYSRDEDPDRSASWEWLDQAKADVTIWIRSRILDDEPPPSNAPLVLVCHDINYIWPTSEGYDMVGPDYAQGGAVAGHYLRALGCKTVTVLACSDQQDATRVGPIGGKRIAGFEQGWGALIEGPILLTRRSSAQQGAGKVEEFLNHGTMPDAVFAINDGLASGFCHGLIAHGIQPGKDIKVIGFDAQPPMYEDDPPLTSVRVPMEEMGRAAVLLAVQRAESPKRTTRRLNIACTLAKGATA